MAARIIEEAFESPRLVLDGARGDIQQVKELTDAFMAETPCRMVVEQHGRKGIGYVEILKGPPQEIRRLVYRSVNDLRNALDQVVYAASAALGAASLEKVSFPFRESPADLERAFTGKNGMCRDVPPELHPLIRSFEPYPKGNGYSGGDEQLRHLGRVSNPNKHSVALRIQPVFRGPIEMAITTTVPGALRPIKPSSSNPRITISTSRLERT